MIVEPTHDDYKSIKEKLKNFTEARGMVENSIFDLTACEAALKVVTAGTASPDLLSASNSAAYTIRKDAMSQQGVTMENLATFAALEVRLINVEKFVRETFSHVVLRERQDSRARYEISDRKIKISDIFSSIEEQKRHLCLADYSVSQTSLEQVFNMHAAEAEQQKTGRIEHNMVMDCNTADSTRSIETIEGQFSSQETDLHLHSHNRHNMEHDLPYDESSLNFLHESLPFDENYCIP
jgi:hypothetical protein